MKNKADIKYEFEYEKLKKCPYCGSINFFIILEAPDRLTGIPGRFYLSKCKDCGLAFQNPRIKEEFIHLFYNESLGYYNPPKVNNSEDISKIRKLKKLIYRQTLVNNFNYTHLGNPSLFFKILTLPIKNFLRLQLTPIYVKMVSYWR